MATNGTAFAATAHIDLDALTANLALVRARAPSARVMAAVKANAYGHGIVEVATALTDVDALAVARIDEAAQLRAAGIETPITILEGVFDAVQMRLAAELRCDLVVHCDEQIALLRAYRGVPFKTWLKVNTGMNRIGFQPPVALDALQQLTALTGVGDVRIMTHFASADVDGHETSARQLNALTPLLAASNADVSVANSAALFSEHPLYQQFAESAASQRKTWVRPGIALYGISPFAGTTAADLGLAPVMQFESRIIAVQNLQPGDAVGYGGRFVASSPMRIGVVAAGYGDGYPRMMPDGTPIMVDSMPSQLVGRVSMDMLTVDLTSCPDAGYGASIRLWGSGIPVETIAARMGNIGYELVTRVSARVQRCYSR
ncbi:MAG: alanine racemase [Pseudomonadota bacterium]